MSLTSACVGRQILYHEHHLKSPSYAWSCVKKNFLFLMPKQVYVHVYVYSVRVFVYFFCFLPLPKKIIFIVLEHTVFI